MLFVDGENFTCRGQEFAKAQNLELFEGPHWKRDVFLWIPSQQPLYRPGFFTTDRLQPGGIRARYYTSCKGDHDEVNRVREALWGIGFEPHVFKREKERSSKGVDIALTKDLLTHAFQNHYDTAILMSGDADYVPVVEEVKRFGKRVLLASFEGKSLSDELRLACDEYQGIDRWFHQSWISVTQGRTKK
jgi:hypothetical protein